MRVRQASRRQQAETCAPYRAFTNRVTVAFSRIARPGLVLVAMGFSWSCGGSSRCPRDGTPPVSGKLNGAPNASTGAPAPESVAELCSSRDLIPEAAVARTIPSLNRLWFTALGKRCACWEGKLMCIELAPPRCFWNGRWYGQSEQAYLGTWCACEASEWSCGRRGNPGIMETRSIRQYLVFQPQDTTILQEEERHLSDLAVWILANSNRGIALAGLVDIDEGKLAIPLAEQRVENIRNSLRKLGVTEERFLILPVELDPQQGDRLRRVRYELIPKPKE